MGWRCGGSEGEEVRGWGGGVVGFLSSPGGAGVLGPWAGGGPGTPPPPPPPPTDERGLRAADS
eukprot:COSAG02_NODE_7134_length_3164_cov_160.927569_1_plen_63_part_00